MNNSKVSKLLNIRIDNNIRQEFKQAAVSRGTTMTDAIKEFIENYINKKS